MNGLVFGVLAAILGSAAHASLLRLIPVRWRLLSLPPLLLAALAGLTALAPAPCGRLTIEDGVVCLALTFSLGFAYALVLAGVVNDSPTLSIVNEITAHGPTGMPTSAFTTFIATHTFIDSRLAVLLSTGELQMDGGDIVLATKFGFLLRLGSAYRRLRGSPASEAG